MIEDIPFRTFAVTIEDGKTASLTADFGSGRKLSGIIKNQRNEPVTGAWVWLEKSGNYSRFFTEKHNNPFCMVQSGEFGLFSFAEVQDGDYILKASKMGEGCSDIQNINVKYRDNDDLVITLHP